jgi:membrane dipeptidase
MIRPLLCLLALATPAVAQEAKRKPVVVTDEALKVHAESFVFDGHNDLPWELRRQDGRNFQAFDITKNQPKLHTDIPRLRKGNVGAQFWSAYVPVETAKTGEAVKTTLEQIDLIHRMVAQYPDTFEFATTVADIDRIRKAGKIASLIGIEGGHSIDSSLELLRTMHRVGVRYMTLTHSENTPWADSATDTPKVNGLSPFGENVVREMNRLGMLVDLSHVSPDCMKAALKISTAPVIFSHSSARGIADHPRNVPDDVLPLVKSNGGVVMVNFFSGFVVPEAVRVTKQMFETGRELRKKYPNDDEFREAMRQWQKDNPYPRGTVHDLADHIDRIVKLAGIDHVGLGSDYDGITRTPEQLDDVSTYPVITQVLLDRGYSPADIHKIMSGNVMRVLREAERVAAKK